MDPVSTIEISKNNSDRVRSSHGIRLIYLLPIIIVGIITLSSFGNSYADSVIAPITVSNGPGYLTPTINYIYSVNPISNTVTVIDSSTYAIVDSPIPVGALPYGIAYDSVDNKVYVTNSGDGSISVINPSTNIATTPINGLNSPTGIVFDSTNNMIYVANTGSGSVSVIDPHTDTISGTGIHVGGVPYGLAFDKTHNRIYVADSGGVAVIDASTNNIVANISVGTNPQNLVFDSTNGCIYVANSDSNSVSVINTSTNAKIGSDIPVGNTPLGITFNSGQNTIYVANSHDTTVSIIDGNTNTVTSTFTGLQDPFGVTYDPSTGKIFVSYLGLGIIQVLDPATGSSGGTTPPPPPPPPLSLTVYPPPPAYPLNHLGANVVYTAPTTSGGSGNIGVPSCDHASGSLFPMGTTTVSCTATDSTSSVTKTFNVQVYTTSDITQQLKIHLDSINLSYGLTNSLYVKISQFITTTGNANQVNTINAFKNEVDAKCCGTDGKPLSTDQANDLKKLANYIIASLS
ncbi:MAG: HYR domain-containing protein [Thaumarchaeota archaeon]|nr:HYR domain-containing protein [Nitrososphaerota archaeon]